MDRKGLIYRLVHDIDEDDWRDQVQIIGWIYQYYNSQLKDETFALLKKNIKITRERIPSATQLFTPEWIVRYMVENSLGRLWVEGHPDEELKQSWKYYLEEAKQEPEVEAQLADIRKEYAMIQPEEILCVDCCMGSGHILVCMFDVLMQIYESVGYSSREAVRSIIEHNLYGLDIDERAYQLAYFAVMMKARQYDRRFLTRKDEDGNPAIPAPHVYAIHESNGLNRNQLKYFGAGLSDTEKENAVTQVNGLLEQLMDAKEYGSILNVDSCDWELLRRFAEKTDDDGQMDLETSGIEETQERLKQLIDIGKVLAQKYHVVCTNPPYMGGRSISSKLGEKIQELYPDGRQDLFAVFIERCLDFAYRQGFISMITMHSFMFLASYEKMRYKILDNNLVSLIHLGIKAFDEIGNDVVQTASYVFRKYSILKYRTLFCRLVECKDQKLKQEMFLKHKYIFSNLLENFLRIPGGIMAYWVPQAFIENFETNPLLGNMIEMPSLNKTGDNEKYLRHWWEVSVSDIDKRWIFYSKGGNFRRYYGNMDFIIDWSDSARWYYKNNKTSNLVLKDYWFREGITYSAVTSRGTGFRYLRKGCVFDMGGPVIFIKEDYLFPVLALLNSSVATYYFNVMNPSINLQIKDIKNLPVIIDLSGNIVLLVKKNVELAQVEWDFYETSFDFVSIHHVKGYLSDLYEFECENRKKQSDLFLNNMKKINEKFADLYRIPFEVLPSLEERDNAISILNCKEWTRMLISYAVGCMFGRYSLDTPGLAYAGGEWDTGKYSTFIPDSDNCIPITDKAYFEDDIVCLFEKWIETVYGTDTLEENLDFIANALGNKGSTSREIIRNYFINEFFKNHCKIYQKRPIYWLFDSGKQNGFKALVYLHRYDEDTPGRVLMYLQKVQKKYETEIMAIDAMLEHITDHRQAAVEEKRREHLRKQIDEIKDYDERLEHMVNERIHIDLDDGVKVNYEKVQKDRLGKRYQILASIK